jgi:hypothetical protein
MRRDPNDRNVYRATVMACVLAFVGTAPWPTLAADPAPVRNTSKSAPKPVWVQAAAKHGGSGVSLRYSLAATLQPNVPAALQLQFAGISEDDASVEVRAPVGVTLTDANGAPLASQSLPRGQITTLSLTVTAAVDGMQFIDVFTTQGGRGSAQSVPLKVGKGEMLLKKSGDLRIEPNGERVISMPAQ